MTNQRFVWTAALALGAVGCDANSHQAQNPVDAGPPPMSSIQYQVCDCPGGRMGVQLVGTTTCSCSGPDGGVTGGHVMAPPVDVPVLECPNQGVCPTYPDPDTLVAAKSCCTSEGRCGSQSDFLFGRNCVDRIDPGPDGRIVVPPFVNNDNECPSEQVVFMDANGCCLPSGECGLDVRQVSNWADIGCISREEMRRILNTGTGCVEEPVPGAPISTNCPGPGTRLSLAGVFGLTAFVPTQDDPNTPRVEWSMESIPCDPTPR